MSQGDVAKKLGWSLSKMQRIEGGEVAVSPTDLRALLDLYGVVDPSAIARLTNDAHVSRRQRWVTPPEHREHLTLGLRQLLQFEREAVSIRVYQNFVLPGVLQTPRVAEIVLTGGGNRMSEEAWRVRLDVRMHRRRSIIESASGPDYMAVLDESIIKRHVGGPEIMAEQLDSLVAAAESPSVAIRVVPFEKGPRIGLVESFMVINLSDVRDDAVVYREAYDTDRIADDPDEVSYCRDIFDKMWEASLTEAATLRAFAAEAAGLRTLLDADHRL
jgi:hypothetical protein